MLKKFALGAAAAALLSAAGIAPALADLYVPSLTYRTGPFAGGGIPLANGYADYFTMRNERDGGIGGVKVNVEECETGYDAQKGTECYESTKGKGALIYQPWSTGITLQLIPKAPVDKIPVWSMGYGLSAAAIGEKFPYTFTYPASYWSQMSSILSYIKDKEGGSLDGKKIGFIYLDAGYGKEPIPLLQQLSKDMNFEVTYYPVGVKEMQNQSSQWLNVRKDRPDWMVMWGFGAMNAAAVKEAAKIRFPMDKFIGNWWAGAHADLRPVGETGKGYLAANFAAPGTDFQALKDIQEHVVSKGKSQSSPDNVGDVLYNRGVIAAAVTAEAIRIAQETTGNTDVTGEDVRAALEKIDLTQDRLKELGFENFAADIKGSCKDHEGAGSIFLQQWTGSDWERITDLIPPMTAEVQPLLEKAAEEYVADKPQWKTQDCAS